MSQLQRILEDCRLELAGGAVLNAVEKLSGELGRVNLDKRVRNEIILHLSRLRAIDDKERKGLSTPADAQTQRNHVTNSVLELLDEIPKRVEREAPTTVELNQSNPVAAQASDHESLPESESLDVFLSHNSADKPVVRAIAQELQRRGVRAWFDESDLPIGQPWIPELESAMKRARAVAVFVGPTGLGRWQTPELWVFLRKSFERGAKLVPILLPGVETRPELPELLSLFNWVDLSLGLDEAVLDELANALRARPSS